MLVLSLSSVEMRMQIKPTSVKDLTKDKLKDMDFLI